MRNWKKSKVLKKLQKLPGNNRKIGHCTDVLVLKIIFLKAFFIKNYLIHCFIFLSIEI